MHLHLASLKDRAAWTRAGFLLPNFDIRKMRAATEAAPEWVHFGSGNLFRAFLAAAAQRLLDAGLSQTGVIACGGYDGEVIDRVYLPYDNLTVLALLRGDGTVEKRVIASVAEALRVDGERPRDEETLRRVFEQASLRFVSFTITEKGYAVRGADGKPLPFVQRDIEAGPERAVSLMARLPALLDRRFRACGAPIALVSMDNCSHNGEKLKDAVLFVAREWRARGMISEESLAYMTDEARVSFPWTMIDKITPRPDARVAAMLEAAGFEDAKISVTEKHSHTAAFVNAEEAEYLVVEDRFPNGRPPLEKAGVYFTDRDTVSRVERMKVCTCLNPLHTALALAGCLLGCPTIASEMNDPALRALARRVAEEGMRVVTDPGILSPRAFADEVIEKRLPNPFLPDAPERIATDTSQKLAVRFGETVKAYLANPELGARNLHCAPFVFALYLRYLMGVRDDLTEFAPSPDPLLGELRQSLSGLAIGGDAEPARALLSRADLFGVDLTQAGLADAVLSDLQKMLAGRGAVRRALEAFAREA